MQPRLQVSRAAIELIKRFEGLRLTAAQLEDGRWTIGYGHTLTAREGAEVSEADAEALLLYDLIGVAYAVNEHVYAPLNQNQFDALCAFAFNVGIENFRRSAALRRLNEGLYLQAAASMELWRKADFEGERIVIDALVRRRAAEKTLFLTPPGGWVAAPSAVLPPKVDYDVAAAIPAREPRVVETPLDQPRAVAEARDAAAFTALEDEESAAEAAAAAVTARLQAIFAEEDEELEAEIAGEQAALGEPAPEVAEPVEEPAPIARKAEPATPTTEAAPEEPEFTLTPPEESHELPEEPVTVAAVEPVGEREPDLFEPVEEAPSAAHEASPAADPTAPTMVGPRRFLGATWPDWAKGGLWLAMIVGGVGLLVGVAYTVLYRDDPFQFPVGLGAVVGSTAILLLGLAAYMFLRMLDDTDEDDEVS